VSCHPWKHGRKLTLGPRPPFGYSASILADPLRSSLSDESECFLDQIWSEFSLLARGHVVCFFHAHRLDPRIGVLFSGASLLSIQSTRQDGDGEIIEHFTGQTGQLLSAER